MATNFRGINLSHILTDDEWDRLKVSAIEQHTSLQRLMGAITRAWLRSPEDYKRLTSCEAPFKHEQPCNCAERTAA